MGASQHTMSQQLLFYVPGERGVKTLGMIGVVCRKCAFGSWLNLSGRRAETLVLLFDEVDLDLELPALIDPDNLLQGELFDTGPPQAPLQQVANRLDGEYKFTGSLQHATTLRLVHARSCTRARSPPTLSSSWSACAATSPPAARPQKPSSSRCR